MWSSHETLAFLCARLVLHRLFDCTIIVIIKHTHTYTHTNIYTHTQGKVEEDRYLKVQENQWLEKLRTLKAQEEKDRHQKHQDEVVGPVKKDLFDLLSKTGDRISDEGLENLAKFRLDL